VVNPQYAYKYFSELRSGMVAINNPPADVDNNAMPSVSAARTHRPRGGSCATPSGHDEVIGAFAVYMQTGLSWKRFRRVVFPHPTVSELMPWITDGLKPLE
jgi:pyruvate/2-oxoglutarate dehydrogenase complex dihydrolipoamide dehydrogenase (E3) component